MFRFLEEIRNLRVDIERMGRELAYLRNAIACQGGEHSWILKEMTTREMMEFIRGGKQLPPKIICRHCAVDYPEGAKP